MSCLHDVLEQVKLYPPYPVNEPRRAEGIRELNGRSGLEDAASTSISGAASEAIRGSG
jgi:hypothetical protein